MSKEELRKKVDGIMSSPSIRIEAVNGLIYVFKMCYTKDELYIIVRDDTVEIDGVVHEL